MPHVQEPRRRAHALPKQQGAVKAAEAGHRVLFLTLEELMTRFKRAQQENRLERQLQQFSYPKVLIVDEIGYLLPALEIVGRHATVASVRTNQAD